VNRVRRTSIVQAVLIISKKNMNKLKTILISGLFLWGGFLLAPPAQASVAEMENQLSAAAEEGAGYSSPQDPRTTIATIIKTGLGLIGIVFLILMLYAGVMWMTSAGNEERVSTAKKILSSSVIGLVIVLCAYSITIFVVYLVTGGNRNVVNPGSSSSENAPFNP